MFSQSYCDEINRYFNGQMTLLENRCGELAAKEREQPEESRGLWIFARTMLEDKIEEINTAVERCSQDEGEALRFLYSAMPLSDMLDYPAALFLTYAKHGAFLWREGPFAGKVPEKIFANYVIHHRVHNEDIADTRSFFYDRLKGRTGGKDMYGAAVETNYWCAEKASYQTTFRRTQNPLTMYGTGAGRCGEEAPFTVTALRSLGIPAREAAAPWWSHCDDNHAWVEAWCDGTWHFMGGCEPESRLDRGWFAGPATRAMLIDSAWFGRDTPPEPAAARPDMSVRLNHLRNYAPAGELKIRVEDENGNPVPDAKVEFSVLNYSRFQPVASLRTGRKEGEEDYGSVKLDAGLGSLLVSAWAEGRYGERLVSLAPDKKSEYTIVLKSEIQNTEQWRDLEFRAPEETIQNETETDAQFAAREMRAERAARSRRERIAGFYRKRDAERALMRFGGKDRESVDEILHQACGNIGEIIRFLEWDFAGKTVELERQYGQEIWKLKALRTLRRNDYWDIRAEVLAECCIWASPWAPELPEEIFFPYLLCPTAAHEFPRACRSELFRALSGELKEHIRRNPAVLPRIAEELIVSLPEQEYANLVNSPMGCLTGGIGSRISAGVLCVQIYRALGIPARMRPVDGTLEYYHDGAFTSAEGKKEGPEEASRQEKTVSGTGLVILETEAPLKPEERKHYSLSRFEEGKFRPLFLTGDRLKETTACSGTKEEGRDRAGENRLEAELEPGIYRAVTANRLPNGSQYARVYDFRLREGETRRIKLALRKFSAEALVESMLTEDLIFRDAEGGEVSLHSLSEGRKALVLWLEPAREPTEHILNEIWEKREAFGKLNRQGLPLYFVLREGKDPKEDATLKRTLYGVPGITLLFHAFDGAYERLSCQVKRNPGKLPLAMVMKDGKECIYSDCGYNVGMAELLLRILTEETGVR